MKPKSADVLLTNGIVLTLDAVDTILTKGTVAIAKDTITAVGPAEEFSDWSASEVVDARGGI
ncbi:MAG: S-adenosylhomocysteine deaminase, partial [Desulfobacterales bacterium]